MQNIIYLYKCPRCGTSNNFTQINRDVLRCNSCAFTDNINNFNSMNDSELNSLALNLGKMSLKTERKTGPKRSPFNSKERLRSFEQDNRRKLRERRMSERRTMTDELKELIEKVQKSEKNLNRKGSNKSPFKRKQKRKFKRPVRLNRDFRDLQSSMKKLGINNFRFM